MNRLFVLALAGASAFNFGVASAADIFVPPPIEYVEEVKPDYTGWYIRGDAGYLFESKTDWNYRMFGQDDFSEYHYDRVKHKSGYTVGAGVGYRFAEHFRTDVSADYYSFDIEGNSRCPIAPFAGSFGPGCSFDDRSDADVWTVMANAYVDLPYFGPLTPYFGAGIGFAHVSYGDLKNDIRDASGSVVFSDVHSGEDSWRFASSLMAGVSYDVIKNVALDVGYRYTRVFDGDAYGWDTEDTALGATGVQTRDNGFDIHAVRAGLRYTFF
ncbi:outer membrane protein [Aureimonas populi]|uniref:Outer membrane protein n=1 Tax=Aureimonas populi TaxID=1701758 RepID=A0ABW5CHV8_9HYPH|nr:outer membrane protein [Aureimonas populi]